MNLGGVGGAKHRRTQGPGCQALPGRCPGAVARLFFASDAMTSDRLFRRVAVLGTACAVLPLLGCGSDLTLPPANIPIGQQQITLYALTGTPVNTNSGYDMLNLFEVRVDASNA